MGDAFVSNMKVFEASWTRGSTSIKRGNVLGSVGLGLVHTHALKRCKCLITVGTFDTRLLFELTYLHAKRSEGLLLVSFNVKHVCLGG